MIDLVRGALIKGAMVAALAVTLAVSAQPSARAEDPIKIGFGIALTGGLAAAGKAALVAIQIWAEEINASGGLLGRPVELIYYDDQTSPSTVPGIYTKLINIDDVDLVVSGYGTNLIAPAMPIVMSHGYVFMGLFGLAVNERFDYPYYFQIMPAGPDPRADWSRGFFEIAAAQTPKPVTLAVTGADAEFPRQALIGVRQNAEEYGFEIVYERTYPPATADFTPILRAINATNPDIVFVASYPPDSAGFVRAVNEIGIKAKLFGGGMVGLQYSAFQSKLGSMMNGIVNYDFWVPEPTLDFPGVHEFLAKYQAVAAAEGIDPLGHYLPPWAYSYVQVLGQAVEAVGSLDQTAIGEYIRANEFQTIVGPIKFGANGEWAETRMLMVQYQGIDDSGLEQFSGPGKRVVLYPEAWKSGEINYPYPGADN
jgi:branched-chain amino acid transport system substrate-binding protein